MKYSITALLMASSRLAHSLPFNLLSPNNNPTQPGRIQPSSASNDHAQHQLPLLPIATTEESHTSNEHLDRVPQSVELLLTDRYEDEVIHIWLPLGQRVHPRDYPVLPLHPETLSISNVITDPYDPAANARRLERTTCVVHPVRPRKVESMIRRVSNLWRGMVEAEDAKSTFRRRDGFVNLEDAEGRWYLAGKEVESYECY